MGTSVNQRSPETDNWRIVQDIYLDPGLSNLDALGIVWGAASNSNEANLLALLSQPQVGELIDQVGEGTSPWQLSSWVSERKVSSLATDIAIRAVAQALQTRATRETCSARLFAEATSYLIDRDLPGYVGRSEKLPTMAEAKSFARDLSSHAESVARRLAVPRKINAQSWARYVRQVVLAMRAAE